MYSLPDSFIRFVCSHLQFINILFDIFLESHKEVTSLLTAQLVSNLLQLN